MRITLLFYTYPSHSAPQHTPHWLTEQGAIFHPKSNQPMLSRAVWDNQKGYPDQRPSLYSVQTGLPIRVGELDQNRKGPSSLTDLKLLPLLLFDLYLWPNLYLTMKLITYFYLFIYFCHGLNLKVTTKVRIYGGGLSLVNCKINEGEKKKNTRKEANEQIFIPVEKS